MPRALSYLLAAAMAFFGMPALAANPEVELDTTAGVIKLELYPDAAPKTVDNFVRYVKDGHYNGTQFHRVIDGFMIQGGAYTADFNPRPTRPPVVNEAEASSKAGLHNVPGTIAMARTSDPNSARDQFFINVANNKPLDFRSPDPAGVGYTVFGKVTSGMDVVEKIAKMSKGGRKVPAGGPPVDPRSLTTEPVIITSAKIVSGDK
ncbi:MAG TPA: peptidylprolyl isomerase [Casimicrobiaceae bacterium]|jgi:peptidyl-prolyl cis-trans isomerase A (cyclophilin A)/peptidyl-prolyl cis-trans isomerase B (cyclophilin B)|nr:peptidylprolyl isomerase [Casimicrobiaceae bacterium]